MSNERKSWMPACAGMTPEGWLVNFMAVGVKRLFNFL
jgi:hypothetical protein